jgi:uncharacterized protein (TIGR01777 family)
MEKVSMGQQEHRALFSGQAQRILVTGATGFIGRILCQALLAAGHSLVLWVRNPDKARQIVGEQARCITRLEDLVSSTAIDVVINLAGEPVLGPRWTAARKATVLHSRVHTTQALVAWIAQAEVRPRLMISASAIGYYGVQSPADGNALDETAPGQAIFMSELCQQWEQEARKVEALGVPLALLRLGVVFGTMGALPMMLLPARCGFGVRYGSGAQVLSWIHITDVIRAIAFLVGDAEAPARRGVYNLTAPEPVTQREFFTVVSTLKRLFGVIPVSALFFRWVLGEQAMLLVDGQRVCPARLLAEGFQFEFPGLQEALADLA